MENNYLAESYDLWLVAISFMLASIAAYAALGLGSRLPHIDAKRVPYWLIGGAFAMGIGIWSMHFVGMLAFHLPVPLAYDFNLTLISIVIAIIASGLALYVVRRGIEGRYELLFGSLLLGGGIGGMHYTGMAALKMWPPIEYDPVLVVISLLIAIFSSYAALRLSFAAGRHSNFIFSTRSLISAIVMGIAIAGMHYVGMFAASFPVGSICTVAETAAIDGDMLAIIVTFSSLTVLAITIMVLTFDIHMAAKDAYLVETLQEKNEELEQRAKELAHEITEQIQTSAQHDQFLAAIVEQAGTAVISTDKKGLITQWNNGAQKLFQYKQNEIIGTAFDALQDSGKLDSAYKKEETEHSVRERFLKMRDENRRLHFVDMDTSPLLGVDNKKIGNVRIIHDVSTEKEAFDQLHLMSEAFHHSGEAITITDHDNHIISINRAFSQITGYSANEVIGKDPKLLASGRHDSDFYASFWKTLNQDDYWDGEIWNRRKNGEIYPEWVTITIVRDEAGNIKNHIAVFTDVSNYKEKEAEIEHLAHHDTLTKLPNRLLLHDRLEQALTHARRNHNKVAILFIDLDRFKVINDSLGHSIGDKLLIETVKRLQEEVRGDDTISRQGGDEFIVIINNVSETQDIMIIAERIIERLKRPMIIDGHTMSVSSSIGISLFPDDAETIDDLIRNADTAMYRAKAIGRATYQFFTQELNLAIQRRLEIENLLRRALDENGFQLHYQPKHQMWNRLLNGAEALLRCTLQSKESCSTQELIQVAEETGLILPVGEWVINEACRQLSEWIEAGVNLPHLAINLSARQLDDDNIIDFIGQTMKRYQIPPEILQVEITESAVMRDIKNTSVHLEQIRALGISIAIDDFGTGYSSLAYLQKLPIDTLKIDRNFITHIDGAEDAKNLADSIISLAMSLQLTSVAEGIETKEQYQFIRDAGCEIGQGYFFSRPLAADAFAAYVKNLS